MKLLYATWDGPAHHYLDSLFFPIFERLRASGVETHVVQFSWDLERFALSAAQSARAHGVSYEAHTVPRRPIQAATGLAISIGAAQLALAARRTGADVIMPRAHIPAAMALLAAPAIRRPVVWDSDGLMPDERADFGGWRRDGVNYRVFRRIEQAMLAKASVVVTRTTAATRILRERGQGPTRFAVVANGKDDTLFRPANSAERTAVREKLGLSAETPLLVYAGSIGPQYQPGAMASLFASVLRRRPDAHFLLLTTARDEILLALRSRGIPEARVTVQSVSPTEVASWLRAADAGVSFREPSLSMQAVCPIKIAEYLLSGVPVLTNAGVGDLDTQFEGSAAGVVASDFSSSALDALAEAFVERVLPGGQALRTQARALGLREFSLASCANGYHQALLQT